MESWPTDDQLQPSLLTLFEMFGITTPLCQVKLVELDSAEAFDSDGRPKVSHKDIRGLHEYRLRFQELVQEGPVWINLTFVGELDEGPLVVVEASPSRRRDSQPAINLSGPDLRAQEAGGDARASIVLLD